MAMSNKHKKNMLAEVEMANQAIAKNIAETLNVHYPGYGWAVHADVKQGVVTVHNYSLSGDMGYILQMADLSHDPSMKLVIRSGGEFLERYNLARGELNERDLAEKKVDFKGDLLHD